MNSVTVQQPNTTDRAQFAMGFYEGKTHGETHPNLNPETLKSLLK
jgi:hypothetical protein